MTQFIGATAPTVFRPGRRQLLASAAALAVGGAAVTGPPDQKKFIDFYGRSVLPQFAA
ncbi:MAG TPA: hypothetical protein VFC56_13255 [Stellaceae bacterium]|nr:hypothetical protein [Stellaceae bacterium]